MAETAEQHNIKARSYPETSQLWYTRGHELRQGTF